MIHPIANKEYVIKKMVELAAHPLKKWGQNFLIDDKVATDIVSSLKITGKNSVLEIGPGLGALSFHLAQTPATIDLLEIDPIFSSHLKALFEGKENVHVIQGDVMKTDLSAYDKIIGNLPYYITTPIIEEVLDHANHIQCFVAMIQKEVYPRVVAKLGDDEYGPLSIMVSYLGKVSQVRKVSKVAFLPVPHVDSIVFQIEFRPDINPDFARRLNKTIKGLFLLRRKTILNNLGGFVGGKEKAAELLEKLGIAPNKRPEELPLSFYVELTRLLSV
jgi:16S rRNA (adenine1518-N6/adenine1519-N6)-dimethyltransferase